MPETDQFRIIRDVPRELTPEQQDDWIAKYTEIAREYGHLGYSEVERRWNAWCDEHGL